MPEFSRRFSILPGIVCICALLFFSCILTTFPVTAQSAPRGKTQDRAQRRHDASLVVNLRDYGALGDGLANDSPALQQALDVVAASGGGTLQVPAGHYVLQTPVLSQAGPETAITIEGEPSATTIDVAGNGAGLDLTSEFIIAVGEANDAITLSGANSLLIKDVAFVGVQEVNTDARTVLVLSNIGETTIQHCEFYGLASLVGGGAIIAAHQTDLKLQQTAFLGCAADSGVTTSIVQTSSWLGISIDDCKFVDYGNRPDFYSKTPLAPPYSWIFIGNAAALEPNWSRREAIIRNVFLDEGAYFAIAARPDLFGSSVFPTYEVYLSRLRVNVNNLASDGVYVYGARRVFIEKSYFGWSHNAGAAITLSGVGEAILDLNECVADANTIRVDAERLAVINSTYTTLDSTAPFTRIITTDTPEEDPAQYVRQQYLSALSHDPDPAGHYYWTDQLVRCEGDSACLTQIQTALGIFLSAAPPARFSISGQVVDQNGVPLAAVTVSLSGSQSVGMETDNNGNFAFANVASAGSYVLLPAKNHYSFESQTLVTPTADQVTNLTGTLARHAIAGRVLANTGRVLGGATLTLSGPQGTTTTKSDTDGNYTFSDLAAGGDYVVDVARDNYVFNVSSCSFTNLSADQYAVFEGTQLKFTVGGRITEADGTGLSGVQISLTGSETGMVTTDSSGEYFFSVFSEGNYTITPREPHHTFSPSGFSVNNLGEDQLVDFAGNLNHHTIAGQIRTNQGSPVAGATVQLFGSQSETTVSDINGDYIFYNLAAGGDYVVTVSRVNYTFDVATHSCADLIADQYLVFEGTLLNYTIAGRLNKTNGTPMSGVSVTLSGGLAGTKTTDTDGNYSFTVNAEKNYTINVSLLNYSFSPASQVFTNVSSNQTANFTGELTDYVISGRVTTSDVSYLSGVTLTVSGTESAVVSTDNNSAFSVSLEAEGDYIITPSKLNYMFSPSSISVNDLGSHQVLNFTAHLNPGVPVLMAGADPIRAVAIDSVLRTAEPFKLTYNYPWVADRRTRLMLFATHFDLLSGEGAGNVTVSVEDASHRIYPLTVEYAGKVEGFDAITCIVVRLSDDLTDVGDVLTRLTYRGLSSEPLLIGIGHIGSGAANAPR